MRFTWYLTYATDIQGVSNENAPVDKEGSSRLSVLSPKHAHFSVQPNPLVPMLSMSLGAASADLETLMLLITFQLSPKHIYPPALIFLLSTGACNWAAQAESTTWSQISILLVRHHNVLRNHKPQAPKCLVICWIPWTDSSFQRTSHCPYQ